MEPITFFTADFRNDRIRIAGKSYPAGSFALFLLQEAYVQDAVARMAVFHSDIDKVLDFLPAGYLGEKDLLAAGAEIGELLKALARLSPFRMLDIAGEQARVAGLFTVQTAKAINALFQLQAKLTLETPAELYIRHSYGLPNDPAEHPGRALLESIKGTLHFYSTLGEDFSRAFEGIGRFMKGLDQVERFDESHLLTLAQKVFPQKEFDVRTEYIPWQPKPGGKCTAMRRLYFTDYCSFFLSDFYEGLRCGHYPRRCPCCGKYFLMQSARRQVYCNGMAPLSKTQGKRLTCRQWALRKASGLAKEKAGEDPVKRVYKNRCSAIRLYQKRGVFSAAFAEAAKCAAREHLAEAVRDPAYAASDYLRDMQQQQLMEKTKRLMERQ